MRLGRTIWPENSGNRIGLIDTDGIPIDILSELAIDTDIGVAIIIVAVVIVAVVIVTIIIVAVVIIAIIIVTIIIAIISWGGLGGPCTAP